MPLEKEPLFLLRARAVFSSLNSLSCKWLILLPLSEPDFMSEVQLPSSFSSFFKLFFTALLLRPLEEIFLEEPLEFFFELLSRLV